MKRITALLFALALCLTQVLPMEVSAATTTPESNVTNFEGENVDPHFHWNDTVTLTITAWSNLTSYNNLFADSPTVTNHANSDGDLKVRVIDGNGNVIVSETTVPAGESVTLAKIPATSGKCTFQAKAITRQGSFRIDID